MGLRGYVIIKLNRSMNENELWDITKQFEAVDDIEFAAHVIGPYDFVLSIDTKRTFEKVIDEIKQVDVCGEIVSLKINNVYDKHREIKDLKILNDLS